MRTFVVLFEPGSTDQARIEHSADIADIVAEAARAARMQEIARICVIGYRDMAETPSLSGARLNRIADMLTQDGFPAGSIDRHDGGNEIPQMMGGLNPPPARYRRAAIVAFETGGC